MADHRADGLDAGEIANHKAKGGKVADFSGKDGIKELSNAELLTQDCDVLVPAAMPDQITSANAGDVAAKVILELANGPVSVEADETLRKRNIVVIPDILANAGGVTVSHMEWVQNRLGESWSADEVAERLDKKMRDAARRVSEMRAEKNVDFKTAAYIVAVKRLCEAATARGTSATFAVR